MSMAKRIQVCATLLIGKHPVLDGLIYEYMFSGDHACRVGFSSSIIDNVKSLQRLNGYMPSAITSNKHDLLRYLLYIPQETAYGPIPSPIAE